MADFKSSWTGQQIEQAITDALAVAEYTSYEAIEGVTYHVIWKVTPTAQNVVYGLATSPVDGQLYRFKSDKGVISFESFAPNNLDIFVDSSTLIINKDLK